MSKPLNKKKLRLRYLRIGLACYALVILFFLHYGYLSGSAEPSPTLLVDALDHMLAHPFEIFPIQQKYLGMGLLFGVLAPLITDTQYMKQRDQRPSVENGSAKWNNDLTRFRRKMCGSPRIGTGSPNMILTQNIQINLDTRLTRRNNNVIVFGAAGTGKSRSLILPNILQENCCNVITDPSGELLRASGDYLKESGYEVRVFNLSDMASSCHYNPFHYLKDDKDVLTLTTALLSNTNPSESHPNDPFWEKAEMGLIEACCFYLIQMDRENNTQKAAFHEVLKLLQMASADDGQKSPLDMIFEDYEETHGRDVAVKSYASFKACSGSQTGRSIATCATTRLKAFNLQIIQDLTSTDDLNLEDIGDRKIALFCVTPTEDTTFNFLVGLLYTQLFSKLYQKSEAAPEGRLKIHTRFLLDEFANIGKIPEFPQKLSTMRKFEISCTIILQALSQIKTMYKDDWEVLIANCDHMLYLGSNDETTNKYISAALGKETIRTMNTSQSRGRQGSYTQSYNKTGRDLLTPDELKKIDNNDCIYFLRGYDPFYDRKFVLKNHPNYSKTSLGKQDLKHSAKKHRKSSVQHTPKQMKLDAPGLRERIKSKLKKEEAN